MERKKTGKVFFNISMLGCILAAASVLLLPLDTEGGSGILSIATGIMFWLGAVIAVSGFTASWATIYKDEQYKSLKQKHKPGAVCFFKNRYAGLADVIFIFTLALVIAGAVLFELSDLMAIIIMFLLLLTFGLHFLLNGRVFKFLFEQTGNKVSE